MYVDYQLPTSSDYIRHEKKPHQIKKTYIHHHNTSLILLK